jgi:hypothetical protein
MVEMEGVKSFLKEVQKEVDISTFLTSWKIVMLVTFAEAYVEDAFRLLIKQEVITADLGKTTSKNPIESWIGFILRKKPAKWMKITAGNRLLQTFFWDVDLPNVTQLH